MFFLLPLFSCMSLSLSLPKLPRRPASLAPLGDLVCVYPADFRRVRSIVALGGCGTTPLLPVLPFCLLSGGQQGRKNCCVYGVRFFRAFIISRKLRAVPAHQTSPAVIFNTPRLSYLRRPPRKHKPQARRTAAAGVCSVLDPGSALNGLRREDGNRILTA